MSQLTTFFQKDLICANTDSVSLCVDLIRLQFSDSLCIT